MNWAGWARGAAWWRWVMEIVRNLEIAITPLGTWMVGTVVASAIGFVMLGWMVGMQQGLLEQLREQRIATMSMERRMEQLERTLTRGCR